MRVLLTHAYSWPEVRRGGERVLAETATALAARGHDVTVLTAGADTSQPSLEGCRLVKIARVHDAPDVHERWFAAEVGVHLRAARYDVVHSLMPREALAAARARRRGGHAVVYQELGNPAAWWWRTLPDRRERRRVVRRADAFGVMSAYGLGLLRDGFGRDGVLIPGGVRLADFAVPPARSERPSVLFSGAFEEERKGARLLLAAMEAVLDDHPDAEVWVSGPGDGERLAATASPRVQARLRLLPIGDPRALATTYGEAWVLALPSRGESFGLVVLEAMACGTPAVVADDAALPELITPATGRVCRPEDVDDLARALREGLALAADPATASACRAHAAPFDWTAGVGPTLEAIYEAAVRSRAGSTVRSQSPDPI